MNKDGNKNDILDFKLDGMNTIGILNESLFYESENYSGDIDEIKIPLKNINKVEFKTKRINREKTKSNIFWSFFWTLLNSGAYPTDIEYLIPELIIRFKNENGVRKDILKIKHRNITQEIYEELNQKYTNYKT